MVIGTNHGHELVVSTEDVAAATEKTYPIQGSAQHPHDVTLKAADFAQLAQGKTVTVDSTSEAGHTHTITVSCA